MPDSQIGGGADGQPNILFILADDLGFADLSCYGRREFQTPVLDGLAADGVRLTQGYANSAVCSATRTALATGRYQQRFRLGLDEPLAGFTPDMALPFETPTLASRLRGAGYRTALVGKWHVGPVPAHGPLRYGYEQYFGFGGGAIDYFQHQGQLYDGDRVVAREGYLTTILADEAVRLIGAGDGRPLFMSLHFNAPHWPWEGPGDVERSRAIRNLQDSDGGSLETYGEIVRHLDLSIGRVLHALEAEGMARDTIVVFTSDNGGERFSDTWPLVGVKGELLEGGVRVPLIVRWPGRIAAGGVSGQVMTSMDFAPTLLAAAGVASESGAFDGEDLLAQLTGEAPPRPRELYWRFKANEQAAVRDGDWKYLLLGGKEHLFDLARDPRERVQLKDLRPEVFARLKAQYAAWNAGMLPYPAESYSMDPKRSYPDRY